MTGCTFGKGNLIHRDYGKNAFTFIRRSDGKAIRVVTRPDGWPPDYPERQALFEKVRAGTATAEERQRFTALHEQRAIDVLDVPEEQLFDVREVVPEVPPRARVMQSARCDACGDAAMITRIRQVGGRSLCVPCAERLGEQ